MSSVLKAVGKVFKVVAKVAVVALAVAAVVYTAGAAIPSLGALLPSAVPAALGGGGAGFAANVTAALGTIGINSAAITGAITYAGFGAVAGGAIAGATGKNVLKGMTTGALTGAVTGGIAGATMGYAAPGLGKAGQVAGASAGTTTMGTGAGTITSQSLAPPPLGYEAGQGVIPSNLLAADVVPTSSAINAAGNAAFGAAPGLGAPAQPSFWNSPAGGMTIAGLGTGLTNFASAGADASARRQERDEIAKNYAGLGPGLMTGTTADRRVGAEAPATSAQNFNVQYVVDQGSGQILKVPVK